jgi:hypothetical protein
MLPDNIHIYQVFYDEHTRQHLENEYLPFDNTENLRPDWFEFPVMRNFFLNTDLDPNGWYGFLSWNFRGKTSLTPTEVIDFVASCRQDHDVAILPHSWDEIAYFRNPFEHGELVHPGIGEVATKAFGEMGIAQSLDDLVSHSGTFTFCNHIVAKPVYWAKWLALANPFWLMAEDPAHPLHAGLNRPAKYRSWKNGVQFKVFIQERFPAILLADRSLRTATYDVSATGAIRPAFSAPPDFQTRELLQLCDLLKKDYCAGRNDKALGMYLELRKLVTADYS